MRSPSIARILLFAVIVGVVAYLATFLIPRTYESIQTLYFPQSQSSSPSAPSAALSIIGDLGKSSDGGVMRGLNGAFVSPLVGSGAQTAIAILASTHTLRDVVQAAKLEQEYGLTGEKAIKELKQNLSIDVDKNGMLNIRVDGKSPKLCVRINNAIYVELEKRSEELTVNVSHTNRLEVENRLGVARKSLDALKADTVKKMAGAALSNSDQLPKAYFTARQALEEAKVKQSAADAKFAILDSDYKKLFTSGMQSPGNIVAAAAIGAGLNDLIKEAEQRRIDLRDAMNTFTKSSDEVRQQLKRSNVTESFLKNMLAPGASDPARMGLGDFIDAKSDLASSLETIKQSQKVLEGYGREVKNIPGQFVTYSEAKAEFESALANVGLLEKEDELAKIAETRDPSRFVVVDEPYENEEAIGPRRAIIAAVAFVLALLLGFVPRLLELLREDRAPAMVA